MSKQQTLGEEPKDGDFVSYLAQIEQRQMRAMLLSHHLQSGNVPAGSRTAAATVHGASPGGSLAAPIIEAMKLQEHGTGMSNGSFIGTLGLAFIGVAFLSAGLSGNKSFFLILVGGLLLWQAWKRLRGLIAGLSSLTSEAPQGPALRRTASTPSRR